MLKEFIPYEQAISVKELGFDEPCFVYWVFDGVETTLSTSHNKSGWSMIGFKNNQMVKKAGLCTAPTYQQAFRWFREKHGLISYVHPLALLENDGLWCYEITDFSNNWDESFDIHSPEEAQLECLKKLIEIVKEK